MNVKILVLFGLVIVLSDNVFGRHRSARGSPSPVGSYLGIEYYKMEHACAMVGGMCVHKNDCAHASSQKGLCANNQKYGVECCYSVNQPTQPLPCGEWGGACMDDCIQDIQRNATDCPKQVCCVVMN